MIPQALQNNNIYQPEQVNTYEAGLKSTLRAPLRATFDVTGFYNDFSNQQPKANLISNVSGLSPAATIINAGKSRIYGLELESAMTPLSGLNFDFSYTYLNTEIEKVASVAATPGSPYSISFPVVASDQLTLTPKNKPSLTGAYVLRWILRSATSRSRRPSAIPIASSRTTTTFNPPRTSA